MSSSNDPSMPAVYTLLPPRPGADDWTVGGSLTGKPLINCRFDSAWKGKPPVLSRLLGHFRPPTLRNSVEDSIRRGTGLHKGEWLLEDGRADEEALASVAADLVEWCQERIAGTRRPHGIDQLALAVACAEPEGAVIASHTFGVFRPVNFYEDGGIGQQVEQFVRALSSAPGGSAPGGNGPLRVAVALFSWGDVARETIFSDGPPATGSTEPAPEGIE